MLHAACSVASTSACSVATSPATSPRRDLTDVLAAIRADCDVSALAAAIVEHGQVTALGAVGVRRIDAPAVVTTADCWLLGSCTKAILAVLG